MYPSCEILFIKIHKNWHKFPRGLAIQNFLTKASKKATLLAPREIGIVSLTTVPNRDEEKQY